MNAAIKTSDDEAIDRLVFDNTEFGWVPLVPEISIRLLRDDSPLWRAFENEPGASKVPRPYWAFAWSAGQALARFIFDHPEVVEEKRILDFGAGCGIAAIAAAKAGAATVLASEIDAVSIRAIALNAAQNKVTVKTVLGDFIYGANQGWDVILAGDICYDSRLARHGLNWLRSLAGEGLLVLTGDPGRTYSPSKDLEVLACYACRSVPDLEHPDLQDVCVYRLLPAS